ncbi:MAG: hypothetical protein Q9220_002831 [cf. Caloplaca sp. 1 TL-2023]
MDQAVAGVQDIIEYTFNDPYILLEALQAAGAPARHFGGRRIVDGNKRLAILGDTVLQLVLAEDWYDNGQSRAVFDDARQRLLSNWNLNQIGVQTGLNAFVNRAAGAPTVSPATMAATVEAIVGAVYLDGDKSAVRAVVQVLGLV